MKKPHFEKNKPTVRTSIRIVGGKWKKSRVPVPLVQGLRPTPDRVRETLFNWLGRDLGGCRVADCFAGTGILGLEAASRGAASVWLLEHDKVLLNQIYKTVERLCGNNDQTNGVHVLAGDVLQNLPHLEKIGGLDLIFLDPPYQYTLYKQVVTLAHKALVKTGLLYVEAGTDLNQDCAALGFASWRYLRAGQVHAHLWRKMSGFG